MSKTTEQARTFLKMGTLSNAESKLNGLQTLAQNPNIPIQLSVELSAQEKVAIRGLFISKGFPGSYPKDISQHIEELTDVTKQIKCISAQSVLLHGERIKKAQEILANYREGMFTQWLMITYGNRQTPYSMLRYYEFYQRAPTEFRAIIESAPKKCIYLLASREGADTDKFALIKEHGNSPQSNLLLLIQKAFPVQEFDGRKPKPLNASTINAIDKLCKKLESCSKHISDEDRIEIKKLIDRLQKL